MRTMCAMLEHMNGHLRPRDEIYVNAGRRFGYQALALALGYEAVSGRGTRFLHVHSGHSQRNDYGWKSTTWFRMRAMPNMLFNEAPQDVHRAFSYQ